MLPFIAVHTAVSAFFFIIFIEYQNTHCIFKKKRICRILGFAYICTVREVGAFEYHKNQNVMA